VGLAVELALVAAGGAVGGAGRFGLTQFAAEQWGEGFPWGTIAVNVSGACFLGALAAGIGTLSPSPRLEALWAFAAVGMLGSYTTVSSFSLQSLELMKEKRWGAAGLNIAISFLLCLLGVGLGFGGVRAAAGG